MWPAKITEVLAMVLITAGNPATAVKAMDGPLLPDDAVTQEAKPAPPAGSVEPTSRATGQNNQHNEMSAQENLDLLLSWDGEIRLRLQGNGFTREERAAALQKARELEESVKRLGNPAQAQAAVNALGVIYLRLAMFSEALEVLQQIDFQHVEPGARPLYLYNLGRAYELDHQPNDAMRFYLQAIEAQAEFTPATEGALRVVSSASFSVDPSKADQLLVTMVRKYADDPKNIDWKQLQSLEGATPFWKEGLAELRKAYAGEFSATDPGMAQSIFPAWSASGERSRPFSLLLVQIGEMIQRKASGWAGEPENTQVLMGINPGERLGRRALSYYLAAWGLDPGNGSAALRAAVIIDQHPTLQGVYAPILLKQSQDVSPEFQKRDSQQFSLFHQTVGEIQSRSQRCGSREDSSTPFYHYEQALALEKRAQESPSSSVPDLAQSPGAQIHASFSCNVELSQKVSASPILNRRLADCSRQSGDRTAFNQFDKGVECSLRSYRGENPVMEKWQYHFHSTIYMGSWLRSGIQAGLVQAIDTPQKWGQGAQGYGRRFASTYAARTLRQVLAFGVDSILGEDPHYLRSPSTGFGTRFWYSAKQTFVCQNDRLSPTLATWRLTSAFASEFISNSWRPPGNGLGDNNIHAAFARGLFVLGGDTAGNVLGEFLPRTGKLGRLFRPFIATERANVRSLFNPFGGKD